MPHSSYIRVVPGSRCAVLFLHGILGTPRHFDFLLESIPADWSVYNMQLDGHGGTLRDFTESSMVRWQAQTDLTLDALRTRHECIAVVTHSMGGLLALASAVKNGEKLRGMLLLSPALCIGVKPVACLNALRVALDKIPPGNALAAATKKACGVAPEKRLWRYLAALPRFIELLAKAHRVRRLLGLVRTPCHLVFCRRDELVSLRSARCAAGRPGFSVEILEHSGHFYYSEEDKELLRAALRALVCRTQAQQGPPA